MARRSYTDEFRRQAVDLYESTAGASLSGIAGDLGIARGTLADWVATFGSGTRTATATASTTPPSACPPGGAAGGSDGRSDGRAESQAAKLARLQARVGELEAETAKLTTEREILRSAAKCFAGETSW